MLKANALVNQVQALAGLLSPFLGSFLYAGFGLTPVLVAAAGGFFFTAVLEGFIRLASAQRACSDLSLVRIIREDLLLGIRFLRQEQPGIFKLLLLAGLVGLFIAGTVLVGFPYLVRNILGLSVKYYGVAESIMGLMAVTGSIFVGVMAQRFQIRWLRYILLGLGGCYIVAGLAFFLPGNAFVVYLIILAMFSLGQLGCCIFSTYAISLIQIRTPAHLLGKIMSYVFTLSLCAQPVGQIIYGGLFDYFSTSPHGVLLMSGVIVGGIGFSTAKFFTTLGKEK